MVRKSGLKNDQKNDAYSLSKETLDDLNVVLENTTSSLN